MNIRTTFGYVCIALSLIACVFQLITFPRDVLLPPDRLLVLCLVTVIFALGGLLSFESRRRGDLRFIMVAAFAVAGGALVCIAVSAVIGPMRMEPFKYALIFFYALLYGGFGLALSLVLHRRFGREHA